VPKLSLKKFFRLLKTFLKHDIFKCDVTFPNNGYGKPIFKGWNHIIKIVNDLAEFAGANIDLAISYDSSKGDFSFTQNPKPSTPILEDTRMMTHGQIKKYGKAMKNFATLHKNPGLFTIVTKFMKQRNLFQSENQLRNQKDLDRSRCLHLEYNTEDNYPLQFLPTKFLCWNDHWRKFLCIYKKCLFDSGASCNILSLATAKTTLPCFLENKKTDRTLETAKTGDSLFVVGVTRQKAYILAHKWETGMMEYKVIYTKFLVVIGVAHELIFGQPLMQHPSFFVL